MVVSSRHTSSRLRISGNQDECMVVVNGFRVGRGAMLQDLDVVNHAVPSLGMDDTRMAQGIAGWPPSAGRRFTDVRAGTRNAFGPIL